MFIFFLQRLTYSEYMLRNPQGSSLGLDPSLNTFPIRFLWTDTCSFLTQTLFEYSRAKGFHFMLISFFKKNNNKKNIYMYFNFCRILC